jgi:DnaJ-class molecular chaperone
MKSLTGLTNAQLKSRLHKVDLCLAVAVEGSADQKEMQRYLDKLVAEHFEREMDGRLAKCDHCNGTGASSILPVRINCPYCQGGGVPLLEKSIRRIEQLGW